MGALVSLADGLRWVGGVLGGLKWVVFGCFDVLFTFVGVSLKEEPNKDVRTMS